MGNISSWSSWSLAIHFPLDEWQTRLRKTVQQFDRTNSSSRWRSEQSTSLYTIADVRDVRGRAPLSFSLSLCLYYLVASSPSLRHRGTLRRNEAKRSRSGRTTQLAGNVGVATLTLLTGLLFVVFAFSLSSS